MNRKLIPLIDLFLLIHFSLGVAQDTKSKAPLPILNTDTPCGNPLEQSDFYLTPNGYDKLLVTKVIDGRTIVVLLPNDKDKKMRLGGIDVPRRGTKEWKISQQYLSDLVLGKRVDVLLHGSSEKDKILGGRVSAVGSSPDVNLAMLESGMARYKQSTYLTWYDGCMYNLAAEKAKTERKGFWQNYFNR
jgi:endonuclease YncB( thermonuclease family)